MDTWLVRLSRQNVAELLRYKVLYIFLGRTLVGAQKFTLQFEKPQSGCFISLSILVIIHQMDYYFRRYLNISSFVIDLDGRRTPNQCFYNTVHSYLSLSCTSLHIVFRPSNNLFAKLTLNIQKTTYSDVWLNCVFLKFKIRWIVIWFDFSFIDTCDIQSIPFMFGVMCQK